MSSGRGGSRPGSGRPPGARNQKTAEFKEALQEAHELVEAVLPEPFHGDAHTLLMVLHKDIGQDMAVRLDAAKAAIRFEKPALAATHQTNTTYDLSCLTDDELEQYYQLAKKVQQRSESDSEVAPGSNGKIGKRIDKALRRRHQISRETGAANAAIADIKSARWSKRAANSCTPPR